MTGGPRLFLVAGEPSGDALGGALMTALTGATGGAAQFSGVGGPQMAQAGLDSLFAQDELAVMGLVEVLPRLRAILRRMDETVDACLDARPDALITIDSPSFALRVARRVRACDPRIRIVHYVAPSVWAWRPGRAKKIAGFVDQLLALLPFEPPYFTAHGMRCDFVGHPVAGRPRASAQEEAALRAALGLGDAPILLALPGSRAGEAGRHAALFGESLRRVDLRGARVVIPTVSATHAFMAEAARGWPGDPVLAPPDLPAPARWAAFCAARAALAASGTVTLELAAARTPMVAVYKVNALSAAIARRLIRIDTGNLVNLVSETRDVPELIQERFTPEAAAAALGPLLEDGPARSRQLAAFDLALTRLGEGGAPPAMRAARAVLDGLGRDVAP